MNFEGNSLLRQLFYVCMVLAESTNSPLNAPIFSNKNDKYTMTLPFDGITISRYAIMEGDLEADDNSLTPIHSSDKVTIKNNALHIDINDVPRVNDKKHSICVTTPEKSYYSEAFVFDKDRDNFVLLRLYKKKPFHIRYLPHILIGLGIAIAIGLVVVVLNRRGSKKMEEESL